MKVKICGLKDPENIRELALLEPDYAGFIFYPPSPRATTIESARDLVSLLPVTTKAVGVFVDEEADVVLAAVEALSLQAVQLHGDGIFSVAQRLKESDFQGDIIKAVPASPENLVRLADADDLFTYYLFDTPTKGHGGSGISFSWDLIKNYNDTKPFFLSGGIGPDNIEEALLVKDSRLIGIDFNSRLEISPGIKDIEKTQICIEKVRYA